MGDLICGCGIVAGLAMGAFFLTKRCVGALSHRTGNLLAVLVIAGMVYYLAEFWDDARLARWLPYSNLIVLGNWMPIWAAILAALVWTHSAGPAWRRGISISVLLLVAGYGVIQPLLGRVPTCGDRWDSLGICNQTTEYTCSPAAAASLLRMHGIHTTEQEMADLCLTRHGTSWPGLYRGLKLKTRGTRWDVEVVDCSVRELPRYADRPLILSVGLERTARVDAHFSAELGWMPGVNHSVVLLGFPKAGVAEIADPSQPYCKERWDGAMLNLLWRGMAMRLVERKS